MTRPLKLAVFSPMNPVKSGISDYTERLVDLLRKTYVIDVFTDSAYFIKGMLSANSDLYPHRDYEWRNRLAPYDLNVYQLGNHQHHQFMYPIMFRYPGLTVLHEVNLHRARAFEHLSTNHLGDYLAEIEYCHGKTGLQTGWIVARGFKGELLYDRFPMLHLAVQSSAAVAVHNRYSQRVIREIDSDVPIHIISPPSIDECFPRREEARKKLGIPATAFCAGIFGFAGPGKGLESSLTAFFRLDGDTNRFYIAGEFKDQDYRQGLIQRVPEEFRDRLFVTDYLPSEIFRQYLAAMDVCVNLRYPSQGESSSILLRGMAAGIPVIIPRYRQFREIPKDVCIHIDLFPDEVESLYWAFKILKENDVFGKEIGLRGRNYVQKYHNVNIWCEGYSRSIQETIPLLKNKGQLGMRCGLTPVHVIPLSEQLAIPLANWCQSCLDETVLNSIVSTVKELLPDEANR